jgi:uncharacterized protein
MTNPSALQKIEQAAVEQWEELDLLGMGLRLYTGSGRSCEVCITMIDIIQIHQITQQIIEAANPDKIILFGSYAYGEPTEESDLDVMVVLPFTGHWAYKAVEIRQKLPLYDFSLDLLTRTAVQVSDRLAIGDPFMQAIVEQGTVLYESADTRVD